MNADRLAAPMSVDTRPTGAARVPEPAAHPQVNDEMAALLANVPASRLFDEMIKLLQTGHALKSLDELRKQLRPVLLRRTRDMVMKDLPPRNTEIIHIPPTDEQRALHGAHARIVASITRKAYLTEMDLLKLRQALLMCRMAADSTFLVDKQAPGYSTKLQTLDELFEQLFVEGDH